MQEHITLNIPVKNVPKHLMDELLKDVLSGVKKYNSPVDETYQLEFSFDTSMRANTKRTGEFISHAMSMHYAANMKSL